WRSSPAISAAPTSSPRRWRNWSERMPESTLREQICELGRSIFERGLTHGSTGNISARYADGWLLTPTGSNLGRLDPGRLSKLDWESQLVLRGGAVKDTFV